MKNIFAVAALFFMLAGLTYSQHSQQGETEFSLPAAGETPADAPLQSILLKLPVHVFKDGLPLTQLGKDDFTLKINGETREIQQFFKKSRSLSLPASAGEPGRVFVLALYMTTISEPAGEVIRRFIHEIPTAADTIVIWFPGKKIVPLTPAIAGYGSAPASASGSAPVSIGGNGDPLAARLVVIFDEDGRTYREEMQTVRENLVNLAQLLSLNLTNIQLFLDTYSRQFDYYKTHILFPSLTAYDELAGFLLSQPGEKWLIDFRQGGMMSFISSYLSAKERAMEYLSTLKKDKATKKKTAEIMAAFAALDQAMNSIPGPGWPMETVMNLLLGMNIHYNVIFFSEAQALEPGADQVQPVHVSTAAYEKVTAKMAQRTGGVTVTIPGAGAAAGQDQGSSAAWQTLTRSVDVYYELIFTFNGQLEDKNIEVLTAQPGTQLYYKTVFPAREIEILADITSASGISIAGYQLTQHTLAFQVAGFKLKQQEPANAAGGAPVGRAGRVGQVQIEIRLLDDKNEVQYRTGKSLRAERQAIDIVLGLPQQLTGYFKLVIEAVDQVTGKKAVFDKYIKLN